MKGADGCFVCGASALLANDLVRLMVNQLQAVHDAVPFLSHGGAIAEGIATPE